MEKGRLHLDCRRMRSEELKGTGGGGGGSSKEREGRERERESWVRGRRGSKYLLGAANMGDAEL